MQCAIHSLPDRVAERSGRAHRRASMPRGLPQAVRETCERLLIDVVGLCVAARATRLRDRPRSRPGTMTGPAPRSATRAALSAAGAAFVNGTAAHGEDFDDTFEGGPVHAGAVIVPAVLAAAERNSLHGRDALLGIAVGVEIMCRLSLVAPKARAQGGLPSDRGVRRDGRGGRRRRGAAARPAADRRRARHRRLDGRAASSSTSPKAAWTKRMHAGWAAQSGLRAALLARAGFIGPRTVFEGTHGLFHGFAHTREGNYGALLDGFGERWLTRDAGLQALSLRDHDPSLHRLRAPAARARHRAPTTSRRWSARSARAPCTACGSRSPPSSARRTATPAKFSHALLHRRRLRPRQRRPRRLHRRGGARPGACSRSPPRCATRIDPDNPYPERLHRPHPRARCATAASSRSASRTCAAARTSR